MTKISQGRFNEGERIFPDLAVRHRPHRTHIIAPYSIDQLGVFASVSKLSAASGSGE